MEQARIQFKNSSVTGYYGELSKSLPAIAECLSEIFKKIKNGAISTISSVKLDDADGIIYVVKECRHYIIMSLNDKKNTYYVQALLRY